MPKIKTSVTLDKKLLDFLKQKAKEDHRSVSQLIEKTLLGAFRGDFNDS